MYQSVHDDQEGDGIAGLSFSSQLYLQSNHSLYYVAVGTRVHPQAAVHQ